MTKEQINSRYAAWRAEADKIVVARAKTRCKKCGGNHETESCQIPDGMTPEIARAQARSGGCCDPPK